MAAKKKIYVVKNGREKGLFTSWEDCKKSVDGFAGAVYKSFTNISEAQAYLYGRSSEPVQAGQPKTSQSKAGQSENSQSKNSPSERGQSENNQAVPGQPDKVVAYVDGSFDVKLQKYAFGCILLLPDGRHFEKSGSGNEPESLAIRNVAGEMLGAMYAALWACKNEFKALDIYYDYAGIEKWAVGDWKAKNALTQKYAAFMQKYQKLMTISFVKVAAHTGDYYNEQVDQLAKAALKQDSGIPAVTREI